LLVRLEGHEAVHGIAEDHDVSSARVATRPSSYQTRTPSGPFARPSSATRPAATGFVPPARPAPPSRAPAPPRAPPGPASTPAPAPHATRRETAPPRDTPRRSPTPAA